MPFGLSNVPSVFQRLMNKVFANLIDMCVVIYLDNILIYLDNLGTHKQYVVEVLHYLWSYRLYAFLSKCAFYKKKVKFLGYILGPKEIQINKEKVHIIRDWPVSC